MVEVLPRILKIPLTHFWPQSRKRYFGELVLTWKSMLQVNLEIIKILLITLQLSIFNNISKDKKIPSFLNINSLRHNVSDYNNLPSIGSPSLGISCALPKWFVSSFTSMKSCINILVGHSGRRHPKIFGHDFPGAHFAWVIGDFLEFLPKFAGVFSRLI